MFLESGEFQKHNNQFWRIVNKSKFGGKKFSELFRQLAKITSLKVRES